MQQCVYFRVSVHACLSCSTRQAGHMRASWTRPQGPTEAAQPSLEQQTKARLQPLNSTDRQADYIRDPSTVAPLTRPCSALTPHLVTHVYISLDHQDVAGYACFTLLAVCLVLPPPQQLSSLKDGTPCCSIARPYRCLDPPRGAGVSNRLIQPSRHAHVTSCNGPDAAAASKHYRIKYPVAVLLSYAWHCRQHVNLFLSHSPLASSTCTTAAPTHATHHISKMTRHPRGRIGSPVRKPSACR